METPFMCMELTVNNHPGVMSHVCGLFVRRGCNVEGIVCAPAGGDGRSVIRLVVHDNGRMEQIARHARQLEDVHEVTMVPGDAGELDRIAAMLGRS